MSKPRGLIANAGASEQIYIKHLLSNFSSMHRKFCWQNILLEIMIALDEDDLDVQGRTPAVLSPGRCLGFQLLLEKVADLLEVLFPASPMQMFLILHVSTSTGHVLTLEFCPQFDPSMWKVLLELVGFLP